MNVDQCKKFMAGVESAEIKAYQFDIDDGTHLYHDGKTAIAIPNHDLGAVVAIRSSNFGGSHNAYTNKVQAVLSDYGDIHSVRASGTSEQITKFVAELGVTLTDEQLKVVVNIDKYNYDIIPATGNYLGFKPLTQKQYEALSDEEKAKYDSEKDAYEKEKAQYIGQNMAARITF